MTDSCLDPPSAVCVYLCRFYEEGEALRILTSVMCLLYVMNYLERCCVILLDVVCICNGCVKNNSHLVFTEIVIFFETLKL